MIEITNANRAPIGTTVPYPSYVAAGEIDQPINRSLIRRDQLMRPKAFAVLDVSGNSA